MVRKRSAAFQAVPDVQGASVRPPGRRVLGQQQRGNLFEDFSPVLGCAGAPSSVSMRLWSAALVALLASPALAFDFDDEVAPAQAKPAAQAKEISSKSIPLLHRIGEDSSFVERSQLWYREAATDGGVRVRIAQGKLAGGEMAAFEKLLTTGGYYTLRLPSNFSDPESPPVFASVSVCALMASRFEEHLQFTLSAVGTLTALTYTTPKVPAECPSPTPPTIAVNEFVFNPAVTIAYPPEGPRPIGKVHEAAFLPAQAAKAMQEAAKRSGAGGKGGEGGEEEPKSFFAKYWMYILPVMLALVMGGGDKGEGEGEGKEGEGKEGGGGGAPAAKPAAGGGGGGGGGGKSKSKK